MTSLQFPLRQGVSPAHLSARIQVAVQQALDDPWLAATPESAATWRRGGAYGHSWFVDRAQGLSVVAFTNTLYEGMSGRFVTDLRDAVYGALEVR